MPPFASTQQFNRIETIKDGIIVLRNGSLRKILAVSGVNVALKSEEENQQLLAVFQRFLNSLDFSVQFIIHSRKINIDNYIKILRDREKQETNELLKTQLSEYIEFIKILVEDSTIMTKTFYAVIPFEVGIISKKSKSFFGSLPPIFSFQRKTKDKSQKINEIMADFERNKIQINQRSWVVEEGLRMIGLRVIPLETEQIIELFYNLYNPAITERKGFKIAKELG